MKDGGKVKSKKLKAKSNTDQGLRTAPRDGGRKTLEHESRESKAGGGEKGNGGWRMKDGRMLWA